MKYRTAKGLPFAKAGIEVEFYIYHDYTPQITRKNDKLFFYIKTEEEIKQLISEGWIEEVKPREFVVLINRNNSTSMVVKQKGNDDDDFEYIKVREVIE